MASTRRLAPVLVAVALLLPACAAGPDTVAPSGVDGLEIPTPSPDPPDFVDGIDNPYLPLRPGHEWVYEVTGEEPQTITVTVTDETREVAGVTTTVVRDVVTGADGEVVEETWDWFAQDREGNVWYFGKTTEYDERGRPDTAGSWEAGVDGAQAGLVMPAVPRVGDGYQQELYPGEAEDRAEVLALDGTAQVESGSYEDLLVTEDTTPLEPGLVERTYYARGIGLVHEETISGGEEQVELVSFTQAGDLVIRWDVDERRATPYTRAYIAGMWLNRDKQAFEGVDRTLRTARKKQRAGDRPPTPLTRLRTRVTTSVMDDLTVWTVRPRRRPPAARVIYLHGGGYVHPLTVDYWRLVRALVGSPAEVVVPAYPLAPRATVDDVLPQLLELVADARRRDPDLPTILMGDSAGGALALVVSQQMRDNGSPAPAAVVALCPWLDPTLDDDAVGDLEAADPMLAESGLRAAGRWWAGARSPEDERISPLEGGLGGLPPLEVFIGDRDILRPAVDDLAQRADREGAEVRVREVPAMFHVWMTRAIPEGRRTRRELAALVRSYADV